MQLRKRTLLRLGLASAGLLTLRGLGPPAAARAADTSGITPDQALQMLVEGNRRYVAGSVSHPSASLARRAELAAAQHPFAAILSCADSRVPPEFVFDQGLGDLFVVRVAGNVVTDEVIASLEYAVDHFATPLIMVLGHQRCGAVRATVEAVESGAEAPGHIGSLVDAISPAVDLVSGRPGDLVDNAVRANIDLGAGHLRRTHPILTDALQQGALQVIGAYYSLESGAVEVTNL